MEMVYRLDEIDETARQLLEIANDRSVWAFYGEMGSGKTTLIHTICQVLGVTG